MRWKFWMAALAATLLAGAAAQAGAAESSGYYKGKVITIVVGGGPSGGHARYARLLAPFLQKHTGAREVRNNIMPGGGGLKAANFVWNAKKDGTTIFFGNVATLIFATLADSPGVQFKPNEFVYLGRATSEPRLLTVGGKSPIKTFDDVKSLKRPFVYPSQGTDEDFYTMAVLADVFNFQLKAVTGYEGNADTALAVIKGDGDGHITGWSEAAAPIKAGEKRPVVAIASERVPDYPNVPTAIEIAPKDKKDLVTAIVNINEMHRSYIGPSGLDPKATAAFRAAVKEMMSDPAFIEATKKANSPVAFMDGEKEQQIVREINKADAGLRPILKAAVKDIK